MEMVYVAIGLQTLLYNFVEFSKGKRFKHPIKLPRKPSSGGQELKFTATPPPLPLWDARDLCRGVSRISSDVQCISFRFHFTSPRSSLAPSLAPLDGGSTSVSPMPPRPSCSKTPTEQPVNVFVVNSEQLKGSSCVAA